MGDVAVNCEFQRLKQTRELLVFCGEAIDPEKEARYAQLTMEFEAYFRSVPRAVDSKPAWDSIEEIRKRLVNEGKDRVCKDPGLFLARHDFLQFVSEAGMAA